MFPMPRDDFGSQDTEAAQAERTAQEPATFRETLGSMAGQTTGDVMRFAKHKLAADPLTQEGTLEGMSSPEDLNKKYELKGAQAFTKWTRNDIAEEMVDAAKKRQKADEVFSRFSNAHSWPANMATGMIGSILDPVEASVLLIPGIGEERLAYKLAAAGYGKQAATIMAKAGAGSSAAMAGTAALEPLKAIMSEDEMRDWHLRDALTDVFYAAPFGAIMHAGLSPAIGYGVSRVKGVKPAPYFHDAYWPSASLAPEAGTALEGKVAIQTGVAMGVDEAAKPPTIGYYESLSSADAIKRHIQQSSNVAQLLEGRPVDNSWLFPDNSAQARKLAPEAHEEWDRLQAEHDSLSAEHVWGAKPTPEQLNDPAWRLEQELRDHVRNQLPVSWDLRVAAGEAPALGENGMASFGGVEAKEAPLGHLDRAESMEKSGSSREGIWRDTGWRKDVDGKWKFEIDDSKATIKDVPLELHDYILSQHVFNGSLSEVLDHPELYRQYPFLKDMKITFGTDRDLKANEGAGHVTANGINAIGGSKESLKKILLHEVQHVIQFREKFSSGWTHDKVADLKAANEEFWRLLDERNIPDEAGDDVWHPRHHEYNQAMKDAIYRTYWRSSGEVESRNVEERIDLTPEERKEHFPWLTQDITDPGRILTQLDVPGIEKLLGGDIPAGMKIKDVMYNIGGKDAIAGMVDSNTRTAWISAMAVDHKLVAREESGHAIRASGLFHPEEWSVLRDAAVEHNWFDDIPKEARDRYAEAYAGRGPEGARNAMVEEAIMQRFAKGPEAWGPQGGVVSRLMQRISELLERIGNWMKDRGFQSAKDVFDAMESGKISDRETMPAHPARRMGEIEARMEELKPTLLDAYKQASDTSHIDIPTIAETQRSLWREGFASAMTQNDLQQAIQKVYGPKEPVKFSEAKMGEVPVELQIQEQQLQKMIEEGYRPLSDEVKDLAETQQGVQEALMTEAGYAQAGECLMMAGI